MNNSLKAGRLRLARIRIGLKNPHIFLAFDERQNVLRRTFFDKTLF